MLTRRNIQLDLLQKLDELCKKANVRYVLHGQGAFLAYKGESIDDYMSSLDVLMCQGDAEKIVGLLDDDRYYFEDFRSNPKFDEHYMMFGYKQSLDLKIVDMNFMKTRNIDNHCIRINIHFIEHSPVKTSKMIEFKDLFWKFRFLKITTKDLWYLNYLKKFLNFYYKVTGENRAVEQRYNLKKELYSIDTWDDIKNYDEVKIGSRTLKSGIFSDIVPKDMDGVSSFIFDDFDYYAKKIYGDKWFDKRWSNNQGTTSSLISWDELSMDEDFQRYMDNYQRSFEYVFAHEVTLNENKIFRFVKKYTFPQSKEIYENLLTIKNFKSHLTQSKKIVYNRDDYIEQKDELLGLYDQGNYDELEVKMKPLINSMRSGINLGYTYSVDDDIDQLLDNYLRDTGDEILADRIIELKEDI
ncbi:hypothetical protein [Methanobrevibacter sp.]|uniref:hypothetical protein n=1 Tax=Methanobrevibacter sp. TaxID=66852 RepID=UPI0025D4BADD|nr:hypothetical protein [Methanobrevibacter sp.]MBQ6512842.1 hypothetical protein [Methanobrevibacter sp.]